MDKDTLLQKISTADIGAAACGKAERESKLHWICVYIMQHTEECYSGVLVDWKAGKGIVNMAWDIGEYEGGSQLKLGLIP